MSKLLSTKTFILTSAIILSSCGGGNNKNSNRNTFDSSAIVSEERPLTSEERNIATRICYAMASKSKNFRSTEFLGSKFNFKAKVTNCQNGVSTYDIPSTLKYDTQNNLEYTPVSGFDPNLRVSKKVQTDSSGFLAQICPKIVSNEVISNTANVNNIRIQISFMRESFDGFILTYFTLQPDLVTYKVDSAEKIQIRTQPDIPNAKILGMDEIYSTQKICGSAFDKNKFSNFEQTFISR